MLPSTAAPPQCGPTIRCVDRQSDFWCILLGLAPRQPSRGAGRAPRGFDEPRRGRTAHGHPRHHSWDGVFAPRARTAAAPRDLKPSNVLIFDAWQPKLTDFGGASRQSAFSSMAASSTGNGRAGTFQYHAPELFDNGYVFSCESDMYAFGVMMWELGHPQHLTPWAGKPTVR